MTRSPRRIGSDREWLEKHLRPLIEAGRQIQAADASLTVSTSPPTYNQGYWTGLKLILVRYYMPAYLNILAPRMKVAYIDLFAGPGLNLIGKKRIPVPGSPLLPFFLEGTRYLFEALIYCDVNHEYAVALRRRLSRLQGSDRALVREEDANAFVDGLLSILEERHIGHSLIFVDPEGMQFKFDALRRLVLTLQCDVIVNFPSVGLHRNLNTAEESTRRTIGEFLGVAPSDTLPASEERALELYRGKLAALRKDVSTEIAVAAGDIPFHYHLIPAVRRTRTGSGWFRILLDAKQRIENLGGDVLGIVAEQIERRQAILNTGPD